MINPEEKYSKTTIYKIICKDPNIKDVYVGHTTNFTKRKYTHMTYCNKNMDNKLYNCIRENGGWNNWDMVIIETCKFTNQKEARLKEQEYYELLQANLNSIPPYTTKNYFCENYNFTCILNSDLKRHLQTTKHKANNINNENYEKKLMKKVINYHKNLHVTNAIRLIKNVLVYGNIQNFVNHKRMKMKMNI